MKGKIVLCEGKEGVEEAFRVGAIGILMYGPTLPEKALSYPLPACFLQTKDVTGIFKYISSTRYISSPSSIYININSVNHIYIKFNLLINLSGIQLPQYWRPMS